MSLPAYPEYMRIKEGTVLLTEADWPATFGQKFGVFLIGAGAVTRDTSHIFGGTGSAILTTGALALDVTEVKVNFPNILPQSKIVAFEQKFIPDIQFGANHYFYGLEDRQSVDPFNRAKIRYTVSGDVFEYESAPDVYTAMPDGGAVIDRPFLSAVNGAGDKWAWSRVIANFDLGEYVSFEYESINGYKKIDMKGIPLPSITAGANITTQLLCFGIGETPTTTVTVYRTTDWVVSKVPF